MANRILRDWTASKKMSALSAEAERLFTRLIMKADDFGRFHADADMIRSLCFPRSSDVTVKQIEKWLSEIVPLIKVYEVEGSKYLEILDFGQKLRITRSKYPEPSVDNLSTTCLHIADNLSTTCPPETKRNETETEVETETELASRMYGYSDFISDFNQICGREFLGDKKSKGLFHARIKEGFQKENFCRAIRSAFADPFHAEKGFRYLTPEYITRSDQLQKWMNVKEAVTIPIQNKQQATVDAVKDANEKIRANMNLKQISNG